MINENLVKSFKHISVILVFCLINSWQWQSKSSTQETETQLRKFFLLIDDDSNSNYSEPLVQAEWVTYDSIFSLLWFQINLK